MRTNTIVNQLTDLEIVKVFRHYPLCPVAIFDDESNPNAAVPDLLRGLQFDLPQVYCEQTHYNPKIVKLQLMPVHHISNDQIREACRLFDNSGFMFAAQLQIIPQEHDPTIKRLICDCRTITYVYNFDTTNGNIALFKDGRAITYTNNQAQLIQWYFNNRFAIPLHFEPGHWANGKTAIELGIAIPDRQLLKDLLAMKFDDDKTEIGNWWLENEKLNINDVKVMDEVIASLKMELSEQR